MINSKKILFSYLLWLLPLLFFIYQFILRLWPGLMMQQIMQQFSIDASHFGVLAALYYYGYAGMQIPVAILLERFPTRHVLFAFAFLCGIATWIFVFTESWFLACLSRFLVGAASAVGFLGVSKVVSQCFPKKNYAKMIGFSFSIGLLGAIYGGKPISMLITCYSWQKVALVLAGVALLLGIIIYFCLRLPQQQESQSAQFKFDHFKTLLKSPFIWLLAFANFLMVGSLEGFADIWGVPYLMTAFHLPKAEAAQLISFVFVGMLFGGPVLAFCSKKMSTYSVISLAGVVMAIVFLKMLSITSYHWHWLAVLFFCIGMMCCYQVLVFSAGSELVKPHLVGVTVAFLNCINMFGGSFFHTLIGKLMDNYWLGAFNEEGLRQYSLASYKTALSIIPYCALGGAGIIAMIGLLVRRQATPYETQNVT